MEKTNVAKNSNRKIKTRVLLVIAFLLIFALCTYVSYRGTYLETIEVGEQYKGVFAQNLKYKYGIMGVNFVVLFLTIYLANNSIKKVLKAFFEEEKVNMPKLPNKSIALILSAIISIVVSDYMREYVALFMNSAWFGINDPIFNKDIGYYIFQMPFIEILIYYFIIVIVAITLYSAIYYIIVFNKYFDGINAQTLKNSKVINKLTNNILIIGIAIALLILVSTQGMVCQKFLSLNDDSSTALYGAGITDVTIKLWGYRILSLVVVVSLYLAIKAFKEKKIKNVLRAIAVVPIYLFGLFILMTGFKLIYINSNELDKEKTYISYNIENTKNAYNIKIDEFDVQNNQTDSLSQIENNQKLLNNITIVNEDITLKTIGVTQTSTGYYSYRNTSIGNYNINGENELVYISPREIVSNGDRTYNNKTYEYTHGYGAIITSASSTDSVGTVEYIQKDFVNNNQAIYISQPRIYFGLETNNTIVTNSKNKAEFDYPTTSSLNKEYSYDGKSGLKVNFIDRLILAIKEKDINLAFSNNITNESKILINRNILDRVKTIMPYIIYDSEPYLVISDEGKLVWVIDGYTVTDKYPYSQMTTIEHDNVKEQINYIRNSVKVLVDAYDGTTTFYITDKSDPIIMAYNNIYPTLFSTENIPEDISKHFKYPEFLYNIQSEMLERYHDVSTDVLYRSDDVWDIAKYSKNTSASGTKTGTDLSPYYTMLKVEDSSEYELGLVIPYTQLNKQSLRAYLVGKYDNEGNAKLSLYKFPQDSTVLGPIQLDTLILQDENISKELETLNISGTKIIKNIIMVPVNNTVLYVEPIYQISLNETDSIPVLRKVVVSTGNKVAIDDTLNGAIKKLLSQSAVNIEVENTDTIEELVNAIIKANDNLQNSNANNDWEMIGKDMQKLQELIKKLEIVVEKENKNKVLNNTIESNGTSMFKNIFNPTMKNNNV